MRSIISIHELSREEILSLIHDALERKNGKLTEIFDGVIASLFYESSTRTRESTNRAAERLGLRVMGFGGIEGTSVQKGEPLADTIRMYQSYGAKILAMRHSLEGAARFAADVLDIPVINCGDGSNGHPTQTLIDLMTIIEKRGTIDGLRIALVGDLKYGRTVHSLVTGLNKFRNVQLWLVAPDSLKMPEHFVEGFNGQVRTVRDFDSVIGQVDVIYMTRIQRERFPQGLEGEHEFERVAGLYQLTSAMMKDKRAGVMHPLPRYKHRIEIDLNVDELPNAWYIEQARNGLFLREALIAQILSGKLSDAPVDDTTEQTWIDLPVINGTRTGQHMIYRLDNGTLIDHIHAGRGKDVLNVLRARNDTQFVYASNIRSQRNGAKDVVGFTDREMTDAELSKIALVEPDATINIIRDKKVVRKGKVVLPRMIEKLVVCQNPRCITHEAQHEFAPQRFIVVSAHVLKCYYCEVPVEREKIKLD